MKHINPLVFIALSVMTVLSFTNLLGIPASGVSVLVGIVFFFIIKAMRKCSFEESGFDIKSVGRCFTAKPSVLVWMLLPIAANALCVTIALLALPQFLTHVLSRAGEIVSFSNILVMVPQLLILAVGEEIAWRAFFQNELQKRLPLIPSLVITSILFSIGHIASGDTVIVVYDIVFVFINSILYGVVFYKTNNAWLSAISHFAANLFSVIVLLAIR